MKKKQQGTKTEPNCKTLETKDFKINHKNRKNLWKMSQSEKKPR